MYERARQQINHNKLHVAYRGCNKAKYSAISRELLRRAFVAVIKSCGRARYEACTSGVGANRMTECAFSRLRFCPAATISDSQA